MPYRFRTASGLFQRRVKAAPARPLPVDVQTETRIASRRVQVLTEPSPSYPRVTFDPYIFPPVGAIEIDRYAQGDVLAAGNVTPASLSFTLPSGMIGVLRWFGNYAPIVPGAAVNGPPPAGVYYTLRVNESAVNPYIRVYLSLGAIDNPTRIFVRLPAAAKVDVRIQNESAATQTVAARFKGWYWPENLGLGRRVLEEGGPLPLTDEEGDSLL